jgi:hypothetical protein
MTQGLISRAQVLSEYNDDAEDRMADVERGARPLLAATQFRN